MSLLEARTEPSIPELQARFSDISYDYSVRPLDVHGKSLDVITALNCESAVHAYLGLIGLAIPPYLRAAELFYDAAHTEEVPFDTETWATQDARLGDVYLFGSSTIQERPNLHCAVVSEVSPNSQSPVLLHAFKSMNGIIFTPLPEFAALDSCGDLQAIRRPQTV